MLIIPAIDIKQGKVVRFTQGRYEEKVYSDNPVETAIHWQKQGARFIHLVDLDGANTGTIKNWKLVEDLVREIKIPIEFGGGVRDEPTIKKLLDLGLARVVIGTKAVESEEFIQRAFRQFKNKIIVSIDAKSGSVFSQGWVIKDEKMRPLSFACRLKQLGFKNTIYTDISRDGTLSGPNFDGIKEMSKSGLEIIASGGISSLDDVLKLNSLEQKGLSAVIIGKALYEKRFTLTQAIEVAQMKA